MQMANNGFPKTPIVRYGCIILYVATKAVYGTINLRILDDNILLWGWRTMIPSFEIGRSCTVPLAYLLFIYQNQV